MNKVEVGQLLTIASGFDRFVTVDRVTTESWYLALAPIEYREAQQIVIAYYTGPEARKPLGVHHIIEQVSVRGRVTPQQIEDDVRSAKARGIIAQDWPKTEPLTTKAAEELSAARDRDREEARRHEMGAIEATR